jgi:hypothetical protein
MITLNVPSADKMKKNRMVVSRYLTQKIEEIT